MTLVVGYEYYGRSYVIGEAPGPSNDSSRPLGGAQRRFGDLLGLTPDEMADHFDWVNLLDQWPGYGPNGGSAFPMKAARERVGALVKIKPRIYLGRRVAAAFGFRGDWLVWTDDQAVCPHPSGLSRWWNDPGNVESVTAFWRELTS